MRFRCCGIATCQLHSSMLWHYHVSTTQFGVVVLPHANYSVRCCSIATCQLHISVLWHCNVSTTQFGVVALPHVNYSVRHYCNICHKLYRLKHNKMYRHFLFVQCRTQNTAHNQYNSSVSRLTQIAVSISYQCTISDSMQLFIV